MMKSCNIFVHNEAEFLMRSELLSLLIINIDITYAVTDDCSQLVIIMLTYVNVGVPQWQPHRRSGLANLPSVGAIP